MRPRFQPDVAPGVSPHPSAMLIDPEAYDASEQQFAASLEERPQPRFVVEEAGGTEAGGASATGEDEGSDDASLDRRYSRGAGCANRILPAEQDAQDLTTVLYPETITVSGGKSASSAVLQDLEEEQNPDRWRQEVANRLNNYRARRRPRGPRYPSLRLKFEAGEPASNTHDGMIEPPGTAMAARQAVAVESARPAPVTLATSSETNAKIIPSKIIESKTIASKIIEFPRSSVAPVRLDELADPVLDRPRILEAPEVVLPSPVSGGILIEPAEEQPSEKRPGFEMPLQPAPMSRRLGAVAIDCALVFSAVALFAYIFLRITKQVPPLQPAAGMLVVLTGLLWAAYQYLLLVYTGITPGLKLAGLQLCRFDGKTVPRRVRVWRVLASVLSGVSLGLGYAWCFLDEDQLCWHDRITRTYMAPKG